jgi:competence ComEA-like helix-hairpin-helix protein
MFHTRYRNRYNSLVGLIIGIIGLALSNPKYLNVAIPCLIAVIVVYFVGRFFVMNYIYKKFSIMRVNPQFVLRENALHNEQVTVIFTPDEKIVVMDNFPDKRRAKRMFTLKKGQLNINKAWNRVCRVFDSYMTLESLESFYSYDTHVDVVTLDIPETPKTPMRKEMKISRANSGPKFVEMNNVQADSFGKDSNKVNNNGASFVDIDNIQEQKQYTPKAQNEVEFTNFSDIQEQKQYAPQEVQAEQFRDMGEILSSGSNKIDVNTATASEIAILPGINIVGAKKIVEYRDLNGLFKSADDFFAVANVKDHFVHKIRPMIVVGKSVQMVDEDDYSEGRIVDF